MIVVILVTKKEKLLFPEEKQIQLNDKETKEIDKSPEGVPGHFEGSQSWMTLCFKPSLTCKLLKILLLDTSH